MKPLTSLILLSLLSLTACDNRTELLDSLDVKNAVEVMVALNRAGISAERVSSARGNQYSVRVASGDEGRAYQVLSEHGLPKSETESIEACTRPQGFTPNTPELNNLRLDRALELRIERLLSSLPGVLSATTVVRSNLSTVASRFGEAPDAPTATVVIRYYSKDGNLPFQIAEVQRIVAQSIPGMGAERVVVETSQSKLNIDDSAPNSSELVRLPAFGFRVPREDRVIAGLNILLVLILFCVAGLAIGAAWSTWSVRRRIMKRARTVSGEHSRSLLLDAQGAAEGGRAKLPSGKNAGSGENTA